MAEAGDLEPVDGGLEGFGLRTDLVGSLADDLQPVGDSILNELVFQEVLQLKAFHVSRHCSAGIEHVHEQRFIVVLRHVEVEVRCTSCTKA